MSIAERHELSSSIPEDLYRRQESRRLGLPALRRLAGNTDTALLFRRVSPYPQAPGFQEFIARVTALHNNEIHYTVQFRPPRHAEDAGFWHGMSSPIDEQGRVLHQNGEPFGYFLTLTPFSG